MSVSSAVAPGSMTREMEPKCSALTASGRSGSSSSGQQAIGRIVGVEHIARLFAFAGQADKSQRCGVGAARAESCIDAVFVEIIQQAGRQRNRLIFCRRNQPAFPTGPGRRRYYRPNRRDRVCSLPPSGSGTKSINASPQQRIIFPQGASIATAGNISQTILDGRIYSLIKQFYPAGSAALARKEPVGSKQCVLLGAYPTAGQRVPLAACTAPTLLYNCTP